MIKYNTRQFSIEAQQFEGGLSNAAPILHWVNTNGGKGVWCGAIAPYSKGNGRIQHPGIPESLRLRTKKGWETLSVGDYIVRTESGEFVPCSAEVFDKSYERAMAEVIDISTKQEVDWNNHRIKPIA